MLEQRGSGQPSMEQNQLFVYFYYAFLFFNDSIAQMIILFFNDSIAQMISCARGAAGAAPRKSRGVLALKIWGWKYLLEHQGSSLSSCLVIQCS